MKRLTIVAVSLIIIAMHNKSETSKDVTHNVNKTVMFKPLYALHEAEVDDVYFVVREMIMEKEGNLKAQIQTLVTFDESLGNWL